VPTEPGELLKHLLVTIQRIMVWTVVVWVAGVLIVVARVKLLIVVARVKLLIVVARMMLVVARVRLLIVARMVAGVLVVLTGKDLTREREKANLSRS